MVFLNNLLFFSLTFVLAFSADLTFHSGLQWVTKDHLYNATFGPSNLKTTAELTISYTGGNISICIVLAEFGLPGPFHLETIYNPSVCYWYSNLTSAGPHTERIALRNDRYKIGVFPSAWGAPGNVTFELNITGLACNATQYWDEKSLACLPYLFLENNRTLVATFKAQETHLFAYNVSNNVGSLNLTFSASAPFDVEEDLTVLARWNAAPSNGVNDAYDSKGVLHLATPKPGIWIFNIRALKAVTASLKLLAVQCPLDHAGVNCNVPVSVPAMVDNNFTADAKFTYFRVVTNATRPLLFSIYGLNGSMPTIYASRGQIPTEGFADIKNCNSPFCDTVRSIFYNTTVNEEVWYVGVRSYSNTSSQKCAFWLDGQCITDCEDENHGACQPDGRCQCEIDFDGPNCKISLGLGPQYIVLIIIASLVVASAVIGFVAWAYMRRKRAKYEILQ